jgi:hypothetical protein
MKGVERCNAPGAWHMRREAMKIYRSLPRVSRTLQLTAARGGRPGPSCCYGIRPLFRLSKPVGLRCLACVRAPRRCQCCTPYRGLWNTQPIKRRLSWSRRRHHSQQEYQRLEISWALEGSPTCAPRVSEPPILDARRGAVELLVLFLRALNPSKWRLTPVVPRMDGIMGVYDN